MATGRITDHRRHDAGQLHRVTFPSDIPRDATLQKVCVAEGFRQNVTSDVTRFFAANVLAKKTSRNLRIMRELAERVGFEPTTLDPREGEAALQAVLVDGLLCLPFRAGVILWHLIALIP